MSETHDSTSVQSESDDGQISSSSANKLQDLQISLDEACNMIILMQEEESQREIYFEKISKLNHKLKQALKLISSASSPSKSFSSSSEEMLDSVSYSSQEIEMVENSHQFLKKQEIDISLKNRQKLSLTGSNPHQIRTNEESVIALSAVDQSDNADIRHGSIDHDEEINDDDDDDDDGAENDISDGEEEDNGDVLIGKLSSTIHQTINVLSNVHQQNITLQNNITTEKSSKLDLESQLSDIKDLLLELKVKELCWSNLVEKLEMTHHKQRQLELQQAQTQSQSLLSHTSSFAMNMLLLPVHISFSFLNYTLSFAPSIIGFKAYPNDTPPTTQPSLSATTSTATGRVVIEVIKAPNQSSTSVSSSILTNSSSISPIVVWGTEVLKDHTNSSENCRDDGVQRVDAHITALIKIYRCQQDEGEEFLLNDILTSSSITSDKKTDGMMMTTPTAKGYIHVHNNHSMSFSGILHKLFQLVRHTLFHTLSPRRLVLSFIECLRMSGDRLLGVLIDRLEKFQQLITPHHSDIQQTSSIVSLIQ